MGGHDEGAPGGECTAQGASGQAAALGSAVRCEPLVDCAQPCSKAVEAPRTPRVPMSFPIHSMEASPVSTSVGTAWFDSPGTAEDSWLASLDEAAATPAFPGIGDAASVDIQALHGDEHAQHFRQSQLEAKVMHGLAHWAR